MRHLRMTIVAIRHSNRPGKILATRISNNQCIVADRIWHNIRRIYMLSFSWGELENVRRIRTLGFGATLAITP